MDGDGEWPTSEEVARHLRISVRTIHGLASDAERTSGGWALCNSCAATLQNEQRGT